MLVFKLLMTPLVVGLISLAGRRWGARVSGWRVGLPLTSAPITMFLFCLTHARRRIVALETAHTGSPTQS